MKELIATNPKELAIALKLIYVEKIPNSVRVIDADKKIRFGVSALTEDKAIIARIEELYRIMIA